MAYKGFTKAQAKAHSKYMKSQATIQLRLSDDEREQIKQRAAFLGKSVNQYVLDLVRNDIDSAPATPGGNEVKKG